MSREGHSGPEDILQSTWFVDDHWLAPGPGTLDTLSDNHGSVDTSMRPRELNKQTNVTRPGRDRLLIGVASSRRHDQEHTQVQVRLTLDTAPTGLEAGDMPTASFCATTQVRFLPDQDPARSVTAARFTSIS